MQELIGQIAAALVGGTIILILAVIAWRGQSHSISTVQYSAAKEGVLDFAEVLEEDISNLGAGLRNNVLRELDPPTSPLLDSDLAGAFYTGGPAAFDTLSSSTPRRIHFCSWTARGTDIDPTEDVCDDVEYRWVTGSSVQVFNPATGAYDTVPTYLVERFVNGTKDGESIDSITEITFDLFDANNTPTSTLPDVRAVQVTIKAISPLGGGEGFIDPNDPAIRGQIDQTRWTRMIRPHNLTRVPN